MNAKPHRAGFEPDTPLAALQHEMFAGLRLDGSIPLALLLDEEREARFAIYRASYLANLTEALRDVYPVLDRLLGAECLTATARVYIDGHPSTSGDLHDYGAEFAHFLAGFAPLQTLPYLPDVARLEWRAHEAFHAADAEALTLARLAGIRPGSEGELRFDPHPTLRLMASDYPVHRIWQVNQPDYDGAPDVDLDAGGVNLALCREGLHIALLPLSAGTYRMAEAFAAGADFATACGQALAAEPGLDPGQALYTLIRHGLLANVRDSDGGTP